MKAKMTIWLLTGALAASTALNAMSLKPEAAVQPAKPTADESETASEGKRCVLLETVQLTDDQKRRFSDCCANTRKQRMALENQIGELVASLDAQVRAEHPDMDKIRQLTDEIGKARAKLLETEISSVVFVRQTLTAEQLERLNGCCGG